MQCTTLRKIIRQKKLTRDCLMRDMRLTELQLEKALSIRHVVIGKQVFARKATPKSFEKLCKCFGLRIVDLRH